MSIEIVQAWRRVETWLAENAPGSHRSLRAPATDLDIARAREYVPVHEDLQSLLRIHDGAEAYQIDGDEEGEVNPAAWLPEGCEWLPLDRMLSLPVVALVGLDRPDWAPWAAPGDGESGFGIEGASGQVTRFPDEGAAPLESTAPHVTSLAAYLTALSEALESGTGPLITPRGRPGIALDCLLWEDPERVSLDEAPWHPLHP
ncbi:hypothetical protein JL475_21525 [Streptomyces sp. M2CJ-2]|uniref:hypothetical protein n=1 Tax=Streptomyces sp. M2CJ-2 TaxID=2803948 RepID=UPI00192671B7|nr:hypothetical protein [Streptomyces sp. M2CJ-2]MBL3668525.1 hypothetical protein [Streptomyces sp. M2CJ-2]